VEGLAVSDGATRGVAAERAPLQGARRRGLGGRYVEQADPPDRYEERHEFQAALQELRKLPPRLPEVVMIRSQESKKDDVAQIMGISRPRVAKLLVEASACRGLAPPPQDSG
jgi:DNA-directed RNA polymerase specialized sigma24 family protein